jgi:hypothetical protein
MGKRTTGIWWGRSPICGGRVGHPTKIDKGAPSPAPNRDREGVPMARRAAEIDEEAVRPAHSRAAALLPGNIDTEPPCVSKRVFQKPRNARSPALNRNRDGADFLPAAFSRAKRVAAVALLGPVLLLTSCIGLGDFDRVSEDFHYSHDLQPGGQLDLETDNGAIDITGWDQNRIDISGQKYAPSKAELQQVKVVIQVEGDNVKIRTDHPRGSSWHGGYGARYQIRVPRRIALGLVQSTNGAITFEDLIGPGHVQTTNGSVSLTRIEGDYDAHTTNGSVHVQDSSGNVRLHSTNGAIRGNLKKGSVIAETTNGGVDFTVDSPSPSQAFRLHSTNGGITLRLTSFSDNAIKAETTNGGITLRIPGDTNAMLSANNSNSSITTDLTLSGSVNESKHHVSGQLGSGGPLIELHTSTGGIHIEKN